MIPGTTKYVSQSIDYIYPENANALHKVRLTPSISSKIGDILNDMNEKQKIRETENDPNTDKKKHKRLFLYSVFTVFIQIYPSDDCQTKKN